MTEPGTTAPPEVAGLTYEQARAELAAVVERLEAGGCTLAEALALWERGEALAQACQQLLNGASARINGDSAEGIADTDR